MWLASLSTGCMASSMWNHAIRVIDFPVCDGPTCRCATYLLILIEGVYSLFIQKAMLQEDANEQELRDVKEQLSRVNMENQNLTSKVKIQREQSELKVPPCWVFWLMSIASSHLSPVNTYCTVCVTKTISYSLYQWCVFVWGYIQLLLTRLVLNVLYRRFLARTAQVVMRLYTAATTHFIFLTVWVVVKQAE